MSVFLLSQLLRLWFF